MKCPKCKHVQEENVECEVCGVVYKKYFNFFKKKYDNALSEYENGRLDNALDLLESAQKALSDDLNFIADCKRAIFKIKIKNFNNKIKAKDFNSALNSLNDIRKNYNRHDVEICKEYDQAIEILYDEANGLFVSKNFSDALLLFNALENEKLIINYTEINNKSKYFKDRICKNLIEKNDELTQATNNASIDEFSNHQVSCPFCLEEINRNAIVCNHCHTNLANNKDFAKCLKCGGIVSLAKPIKCSNCGANGIFAAGVTETSRIIYFIFSLFVFAFSFFSYGIFNSISITGNSFTIGLILFGVAIFKGRKNNFIKPV